MKTDAAGTLERIERHPEESTRSHPVVFVHGAWHGAWCWEAHFLDYFAARGYHSVAFSFRHHGSSRGPASLRRSRLSDYVTDLATVVDSLPAAPVLVAHSMGGLVVQKYLETNDVPAAVLLASVPPRGALRAALRTARRIPGQFLKANLQLRLYPLVDTPDLARAALFSPGVEESMLHAHFSELQDESYFAFLDMIALGLPKPERVTTPVQVLGGDRDALFSPHEFRATASAYGTTATLFPGMAHDMMLEPAWQQVADTVLDWLDARGL